MDAMGMVSPTFPKKLYIYIYIYYIYLHILYIYKSASLQPPGTLGPAKINELNLKP